MAASKPKWSKENQPSRTLITKMKIPQLEECLKDFGLSTDCETTKRSEELKSRLRSYLYPENADQNLNFMLYLAKY